MQFLMALDESFASARGSNLIMTPLPSIEVAYSMLVQDETQRAMSAVSRSFTDSSSFASPSSKAPSDAGSQARHNGAKPRHVCSHCHKTGHLVDRCFKLHGFPLGSKAPFVNNKIHLLLLQQSLLRIKLPQ